MITIAAASAYSVISLVLVNLIVSLVAALAELFWPGFLPESLKRPLSIVINGYLEWNHPILNENGERTRVPSCSYVWPNGQGDSAKFLGGVENSVAWEKTHGGVYRIWSGMKPEIVLTQPHHLQAVFRDSDKHLKAPANNSGFYMDQLLGRCVGLISGRDWRSVRAVTETPFQYSAVSLQVESFQHRVSEHFDSLNAQGDDGNLGKGLLHPVDDLSMLPFRIVADMVGFTSYVFKSQSLTRSVIKFYGRLPPNLAMLLEGLIPLRTHIFNKHVIRGGVHRFAWARFLPTTANDELARFKQAWRQFNQSALDHAKKEPGSPPPIVNMYAAVASGVLTEEQLLQTLDESLFANLDVTIGGLSWIPVFLAAHPHAEHRLRDEIESEAKRGADDWHRYLINGRSSYLACCVLESSRLRPLAAFSVPQAAPTRRRIESTSGRVYVIPAGTSYVVDSYALNVRNEAWAPDNEAFRPDRFLNSTEKEARDRRYLFWRFGFGPRQCMGRHAADLIMRVTVAHLVRNYELDLLPRDEYPDEGTWSRSQESWITHPDFRLRCIKRSLASC